MSSVRHELSRLARVLQQDEDKLLHALGLFEITAELRLKGDVGKIEYALGEFLLLIGVPEKPRIVEAGAQYAFVAVANQSVGIAIRVSDGDELGASSPSGSRPKNISGAPA